MLSGLVPLILALPARAQWRAFPPATQPSAPAAEPADSNAPTSAPAAVEKGPAPTSAPAEATSAIKPRFELHVPSLGGLTSSAKRSHAGFLVESLGAILVEAGSASAEGVNVQDAAALMNELRQWPDTSIDAVTYAPDSQGRLRWAIRVSWPLDDLQARVASVLASESAQSLLKDTLLSPLAGGEYEIKLPESTLAYLVADGDSHSCLASHSDVALPDPPFTGTAETQGDTPPVLVCRMNFVQTEKDTGATFFSQFSAVTDAVYSCRVNDAGEWIEQVDVHWPPIVGMGAKALLDKVKQTFFVPDEAFVALAVSSPGAPSMIEGTAGFGPQLMSDRPGEFEMVGEYGPGPIARRAGSEVCIVVLPGTGFFPIPDVVVQTKVKSPDKLIEDIREKTKEINGLYRNREQPEPWHEEEVKGRPVFWKDSMGPSGGLMTPASMRAVLFVSQETDSGGRPRDILIVGMTSTSPQGLVERWLEIPRRPDRRYLPSDKQSYGQVWVNWKQLYEWLCPYINVTISTFVRDTLLPDADEIASRLTDASALAKLRYTGLTIDHRGPIPAGIVVVPAMLVFSAEEDHSGGSDVARERQAARQLKVLYHHAKLFQKDIGRWPAEVRELEGYVDFTGNPWLLRVQRSARQQRSEFFKDLFGLDPEDEKDEEDADEEVYDDIDDSIYVITLSEGSWRLGFAPNTFEHLRDLYIDQEGEIHRVEKDAQAEETKG